MKTIQITVFTPSYNRAHLLPRLFHTLKLQTNPAFEWLIVDDESTDDTENVVKQFKEEKTQFPIRYYKQKHGGKHRAINWAVKLAEGAYFFIVDSDDWLPENAIELLTTWLQEIQGIPFLCGVAGQKALSDGSMVGCSFDREEYVDASSLERKKFHIEGDKAEVFSVEVMKTHPFPEFDGEFFVTEAVCWNAIAADGYKLRWHQEPVYYCEYLEDGLTRTGANDLDGHMANFQGYSYYIRQCLTIKSRLDSYRDFIDFEKTCDAMGLSESERSKALQWSKNEYRLKKILVMPLIHNLKRVLFIIKIVKSLFSR